MLGFLNKAGKFSERLTYNLNTFGLCCLTGMMLLTALDVLLRYCFNSPLTGSNEITEYFLMLMIITGIAYAAAEDRHISIDLFTSKLKGTNQALTQALSQGIMLLLFGIISWQMFDYCLVMAEMNRTSGVLLLPVWPFALIMCLGCMLVCGVVLVRLLLNLHLLLVENPRKLWLWVFLMLLIAGFMYSIISLGRGFPWRLSPVETGAIGLLILFLTMSIGLPVMSALILVGLLGVCYLRGGAAGLSIMGASPFDTATNYTFTTIPLFVLMGEICFFSGLGSDLYLMAHRFLGHRPGGLAMGTVAACGGFAAVCGDSMATAVTMGTVALPEMRKYGCKASLAVGCVAAGGTLGVLIPPSLAFILYALLTNQSIAVLFIAGIIPGIMLVGFFMGVVAVQTWRDPSISPPGERSSWAQRWESVRGVWAVLVLFIAVIGGMYVGAFTPTEGAGMGAFGALVISLLRRRLSWQGFLNSLLETGKITAVCMSILIGANIFGVFLATSKLPFAIAGMVAGLAAPRLVILGTILLIYLFLGCLMPAIPMLILTVPIFYPVIIALGFDPIWYGVMMVLMFEMAVITPPMGINVLALRSVAQDCSVAEMFRGTMPFLFSMILFVILLIIFPDIALFLPRLLS